MKAVTFNRYGPPEVLSLKEIPKPQVGKKEILIEIKATAVNSADWRMRRADPFLVRLFFGLLKPKIEVLGIVFSGIVREVGPKVSKYHVGEEIFGLSDKKFGTYAEYLTLPEDASMGRKPPNLTHGEAASIVFGGHTALHFLREAGLSKNQHILIYGASGSVGAAAIQLANYYDARVTAVCSEANTELVRSLGAEQVIDYHKTDIGSLDACYDMVYETVNKTSVPGIAKLLKPGGTLILGAAMIGGMLQGAWISSTRKLKVVSGVAKATAEDLQFLADLAEAGDFEPVIDRTFTMEQMVQAHTYVERGHKKGNVVVPISPEDGN